MEERFMAEALDLAARGRGRVAPNPMVGAVLVKNARVVGRGWHQRFGGPHAEVEALRNARGRARGATLYVTMEPCCFHGKTPACTDAIAPAGIARVVAATLDPNPRVNSRGMRHLRQAGISTSVGMLGNEAKRLNEGYFIAMRRRRPFVILKVAATLDGMIADRRGRSQWITGTSARRFVQELRLQADAVIVGVGTVLADDPRLTSRAGNTKLLRVVLDSESRMPLKCRLLRDRGSVLVMTASSGHRSTRQLTRLGAEVVTVRKNTAGLLEWKDVLTELYQRQVMTVLVEGGARVFSSALDAGIADKVIVISAPAVMGPGRSFTEAMVPRPFARRIRLTRIRHRVLGNDMAIEGYVHRVD